ncbi:hypothetical protein PIB30_044315, partial [Stylosanthes scabra]|nr:hypothetical protein [Stylosanthes scabra]
MDPLTTHPLPWHWRTYHEDISLKLSEDIIISLNQKGYVSDFGALCRTCSTWTMPRLSASCVPRI